MPISKASSSAVAPGAKGDLVVGNATNDSGVLAVGSANQVLTVDSSTATGLKWATPSSGSMTLLSTTTLSGADTTITGISQSYLHLFITIERVVMNTGTNEFYLQLSNNGNQHSLYVSNTTWSGTSGAILIFNGGLSATPEDRNAAGIWVYNYASTSAVKAITAAGGNYPNGGGQPRGFLTGGMQADISTAVNQIYIRPQSNSMNSGVVRIYGVN